jgi:glutamate N-acetyltransferase/amino-acid N-acetyltransferase
MSSASDPPLPSLTQPAGFAAAAGTCGIKPSGKPDLALLVGDSVCAAAAVFTTSRVKGAPVLVSQEHVREGKVRAIVCNSGVSNVATGDRGRRDAEAMCDAVAEAVGCEPQEVLVASTGIIGHRLPMDKVLPGIARVATQLDRGPAVDDAAARAIMTTDLVPKSAVRTLELGGKRVTLAGIAKGSGMIAPNMATMLAFLTTDAAIAPGTLQRLLKAAVSRTFNRMSVDSDQSTSDSVMVLASGAAGHEPIANGGEDHGRFAAALTDLCRDLCEQIVRDGEGVTRLMRVTVTGAEDERDADRVGRSVVDSPLVKCALHGADPNWGRLAMAAGKSGANFGMDSLSIAVGGMSIYERGQPTELGLHPTEALAKAMAGDEVPITIDLGVGDASCEWLGGDLSREYVRINADYTT